MVTQKKSRNKVTQPRGRHTQGWLLNKRKTDQRRLPGKDEEILTQQTKSPNSTQHKINLTQQLTQN